MIAFIVFWVNIVIIPTILSIFYDRSKVSLITVQYVGGEIGVDRDWFDEQEIQLFERQLQVAKDSVIEAGETAVVNKLQEAVSTLKQPVMAQTSKADEILKLTELLEKGVISQEEFEKMKKELI